MRPIRLELQGIRSFRAPQTIDFKGLSFFAILGDTGAGKSSLLEAITYALFNAPTWSGSGVKELMTTSASSMRVRFTFRVGGRDCTITRLTPRLGSAQHLLEYAGDPPERRDSDAAVSHFVRERLGLERETFMKTVMLPQGRFAELLLMKPADRSGFLADVLGLHLLDAMAETVRLPREATAKQRESLRGARSESPPDLAALVQAAAAADARARSNLNAIEKTVRRFEAASGEVNDRRLLVESKEAERDFATRGLSAVTELRALEPLDVKLRAQVARCAAQRNDADRRRESTRAEIERRLASGTDAATLRSALAALESLLGLEQRARSERAQLETIQRAEAAIIKELDELRSECEADRRSVADLEIVLNRSITERENCTRRSRSAVAAAKAIATACDERNAAIKDLEDTTVRYANAVAAVAEAESELRSCMSLFEQREAHLVVARRANSAAHAAEGLHAGDACPICRNVLPADFASPESPALASVEQEFRAAESRRDNARATAEHERARREEAMVALERSRKQSEVRTVRLRELVHDAREFNLTEFVKENERVVATLEQSMTSTARLLTIQQQSHREARDELEQRERNVARKAEAALGIAGRVSDVQSRLADIAAEAHGVREALPSRQRPISGSTTEEIQERATQVHAELRIADDLDRSWAGDERRFADAVQTVNDAHSAWSAEVEGARRNAFAVLQTMIERKVTRDFVTPLPAIDSSATIVSAFTTDIAVALNSSLEQIERTLAAARSAFALAETEVTGILHEHGLGNETDLRNLRDQQMREATLAENAFAAAESRRKHAEELDRRLALIEPVTEVFAELGDALTPGRFPKFIVERKQLELLRVGTTILGRMTGDRYGFSASLGIVDRSIGQERKAHTLSGGETFLASLALSLALVEISERSGVRFESLFLDEGFGTLDPAAFEQALIELEHQVEQGRMIAVITHVARVREFIDDVLRVTKTPAGSEVALEQVTEVA